MITFNKDDDYIFIKREKYTRCNRHGEVNQPIGTLCKEIYMSSECRIPIELVEPSYHPKACTGCDKKFNIDYSVLLCPECGAELEWVYIPVHVGVIDKGFTKLKAEKERKAYNWIDQQKKKGKLGESHEPDGAKRKW